MKWIEDREVEKVIAKHVEHGSLGAPGRHGRDHASLPKQFPLQLDCASGYDPVADVLFNEIRVDGYFLEYDTDRAGGFEPLRLVPKGKTAVLGLVSSKTARLESKDELKRRIDSAGKYLDLDRLCLSPQCGFASTEEGNRLTESDQWAKLALVLEVAREVWS